MKRYKKGYGLSSLTVIAILILAIACAREKGETASLPVQNLRTLARLYGYLRYFHPSDEAARVDWDTLAVLAAGKVKSAPDAQALKAALEEVFRPVAPAMTLSLKGETPDVSPLPPLSPEEQLRLVSWQHSGLGTGNPNSIYNSVRLNRPRRPAEYATVTKTIDAAALAGGTVTLTAWAKAFPTDGANGQARLWLRVDVPSGTAFFDNMEDRPIRNSAWSEYRISGSVAADAKFIAFGALTIGQGRFLFDGFRLSVTDAAGRRTSLPVENGGFEQADAQGGPLAWAHYNPDMDIRLQGDNVHDGRSALELVSKTDLVPQPLFAKRAPAAGVIDKEIGRDIFCRIPLTLRADEAGTLPRGEAGDFERLAAELAGLARAPLSAEDENVRTGGVIIVWNVFQHFYPYFNVLQVDWDDVLTRALERAMGGDRTGEGFQRTLSWMITALQDGHAGVYNAELQKNQGWPPFRAEWVEDRLVITNSREASFRRGDIVLSLNGKPAAEVLREEEEYISGSPQWKRVRSTGLFGCGPIGVRSWLRIERGGNVLESAFERGSEMCPPAPPSRPTIEDLGRGVFYVDLSRAGWEEIRARILEIAAARGVVFDLRGYPNGNHMVLSHLLGAPDTSSGWMKIPNVVLPDRQDWAFHEVGWNLPVASPHIGGRIVFLTDGRAISYAESVMGLVEYYRLGEILGEPTAGANGNVNTFTLPGGFTIAWTGMKVVKHDGSRHHAIGVKPTIPCHRTIAGVAAGKDEFLDKALEVINSAGSTPILPQTGFFPALRPWATA